MVNRYYWEIVLKLKVVIKGVPVRSYTESLQQTLPFILSITKVLHGECPVLQITFEKKNMCFIKIIDMPD